MNHVSDFLKDGISVHDVLVGLKKREESFREGVSYRQRGEEMKRLFPDICNKQIEIGELHYRGFSVLPGCSTPHFVGDPVDWHANPFNDEEYVYFLNRMDHWRRMLEAYSLTGDDKFAKKVLAEFYHWIQECPRQPLYASDGSIMAEPFRGYDCNQGIWRALEIGIRMFRTWPYLIHHLIDTEFINETFLETYLTSVYEHAEVLYHVSPILWPKADHNHYLMENNGLLYLSCMFPEFKDSERWRNHALHELERSIFVQITSGGGQIEGCPSYHNGCFYWFALPILLSRKYHFSVSDAYREQLGKMIGYSLHATRPSGGNCPWGDSNTVTGTFAFGAFCQYLAFGDGSYVAQACNYFSNEEMEQALSKYIWEIPDLKNIHEILTSAANKSVLPSCSTFSWQKDLKQVFFRTDWSVNALSLMFACRTPIQNTHAHMDPCGFDFTAYGAPLLTDPAIFCFRDDEDRRKFKSIHWHNCLSLNHQDPWEYKGSWSYGKQQPGDIIQAECCEHYMYAVGRHENYRPAIHTRIVSIVDRAFLIVWDLLDNVEKDSSVQINFHIDCPAVMADSRQCCARSLSSHANIGLFSDGQTRPSLIPAKRSTKDDVAHDTMIARFEAEHLSAGFHQFATIAVPAPTGQDVLTAHSIKTVSLPDRTLQLSFAIGKKNYSFCYRNGKLTVC